MKAIVFIISIFFASFGYAQTNFRSLTVDTAAQQVGTFFTQINAINVTNLSTTTLYLKFYDSSIKPYASISKPVLTLQLGSDALSRFDYSAIRGFIFKSGCYIRCTTGSTDTSTAEPTTKPIIEIQH